MDAIGARTCRLCFDSNQQLIAIFNEFNESDENVAEIISQHIAEVTTHSK